MKQIKLLVALILLTSSMAFAKTLSSVAISPQGAVIQGGSSLQFNVVCTYTDTTTDNCASAGGAVWTSSRTAAMTVNSTGLVAVQDPGTNTLQGGLIFVKAGGLSDRAEVYSEHPGDIFYQYMTPDLRSYKTQVQSTASLLPLNVAVGSTVTIGSGTVINYSGPTTGRALQGTCNWASSDPTKATVNRQGLVTAVSAGSVKITCGRAGNGVYGISSIVHPSWAASATNWQDYQILDSNGNLEDESTLGVTGTTEPTWPAYTGTPVTTTDGTAVWTNLGPDTSGWVTPGNVITLTIVPGGNSNQTWYIRPGGGTRYTNATDTPTGQCNGKADSDYSGTGVNQPCAFGKMRYLWSDEVTYQRLAWVIQGGDTVIVRQKAGGYTTGQDAIDNNAPTNCDGDSSDCYMPTIPSGSAGQHTRILGENYASCTSDSAKTLLTGSYGETAVFNTRDSQFVDIACFEVTDKAECAGSGSYINTCRGGSFNSAAYGIFESALTASVTYTDLFIHGLADEAIHGATGVGVVAERVHIRAMPDAGIDMDDDPWQTGNISVAGGFTMKDSITEFTGCVEEYPIAHNYPYVECRDQSTGGYGDGFGTASATGDWLFDHDDWHDNFQDGLDLLHSGLHKLTVTNSTSYGNDGQQFKIGSGDIVTFQNNTALHNCWRVSALFGDEPASAIVQYATNKATSSTSTLNLAYSSGLIMSGPGVLVPTTVSAHTFTLPANSTTYIYIDPTTLALTTADSSIVTGDDSGWTISGSLSIAPLRMVGVATTNGTGVTGYNSKNYGVTLCRAAGDGIPISMNGDGTDVFQNNTYVGYGATSYDISCGGDWADGCPNTNSVFQNNIDLGLDDLNYVDNNGTQVGPPGLFYLEQASMPPNGGWAVRDHNLYYGFKSSGCPELLTGEVCADPGFVNEPSNTVTNETQLDNFNFNISASSHAKFTGVLIAGLTTDQTGAGYQNPPSMGAIEYVTGTLLTVTVSPSSASVFTGSTTPMTAACSYSNGDTTPCTVVWTDTNGHSSVNSATGVVTGLTVGSDTITATLNSIFGTATVTMSAPPPIYFIQGITPIGPWN